MEERHPDNIRRRILNRCGAFLVKNCLLSSAFDELHCARPLFGDIYAWRPQTAVYRRTCFGDLLLVHYLRTQREDVQLAAVGIKSPDCNLRDSRRWPCRQVPRCRWTVGNDFDAGISRYLDVDVGIFAGAVNRHCAHCSRTVAVSGCSDGALLVYGHEVIAEPTSICCCNCLVDAI